MKRIIYQIGSFLVVITLLIGCEKEAVEFNVESLAHTAWVPTLVDENPDSNPAGAESLYYPWQDCEIDDILRFSDQTVLWDVNNTSCSETPIFSEWQTGLSYSFDAANMKLTLQSEEGEFTYDVYEYTSDRLKLGTVIPGPDGLGYLIFLFERE